MKYVAIDEEVIVPKGISASLKDKIVTLKGKKGSFSQDFSHARLIDIKLIDKTFYLHADFPRKNVIAKTSTIKNLIKNMIRGVQEGYEYRMKIVYSHFPITVDPPKGEKRGNFDKKFYW